jgi:hypothetical protein
MALGKLYYNPEHPALYASVAKLQKASKLQKQNVVNWLTGQDTCTILKQVRKRFPRNPYTVNNVDDAWEMDLADVSNVFKYKDAYKYLLNVIDVFFSSKYASTLLLKSKEEMPFLRL